mgnify:CR=1 FL=1
MRRGSPFLKLFLLLALSAPLGRSGIEFALRPGESLRYRVYMAGLALGEQRFLVKSASVRDGRGVLLIEVMLDSYPSFFNLLDYHERRTIWWDDEAGVPLAEEASISQRRKITREELSFDHERGSVTIVREGEGTRATIHRPIEPGTQTATSLLYYFRRFPWERGEFGLSLLGQEGAERYTYEVVEEKAPLRVPLGRFERTYRLYNRELKYELWFDRGPGHLPLEIRSRLGFGLAQAKLVEAEGYR